MFKVYRALSFLNIQNFRQRIVLLTRKFGLICHHCKCRLSGETYWFRNLRRNNIIIILLALIQFQRRNWYICQGGGGGFLYFLVYICNVIFSLEWNLKNLNLLRINHIFFTIFHLLFCKISMIYLLFLDLKTFIFSE